MFGFFWVNYFSLRFSNSTTWTVLKDRFGRNIAVCSHLMHFISGFTTDVKGEKLTKNPARPSPFMQQTINEVIEFVRITSKKESGFNVRGFHWFFISGWDRQIKGVRRFELSSAKISFDCYAFLDPRPSSLVQTQHRASEVALSRSISVASTQVSEQQRELLSD